MEPNKTPQKPANQAGGNPVPGQSQPAPVPPRQAVPSTPKAAPVSPPTTPPTPMVPPMTETNTPGRLTQDDVQSYQKMSGTSYGSDKKKTMITLAVAIVVVLLLVGGLVVFFNVLGGGGGESENRVAAPETPEEVVPPPPPVVEKDSIMRSTDSGRSFETYFKVVTEEEMGLVDVLTISFHPEKENNITVSTYSDGLFVNDNGDDNWEAVDFPPQRIYSFVLDQGDPDNRAFASGVVSKNGRIFQTEDAGENWRVVYAEPGDNTVVSALTQNPKSPDTILAGTNRGTLVRSTDGGETWRDISQEIDGSIDGFAHDSTRQSMVYILSRGDVYHSYDGGQSWENWEDIKKQEIADLKAQARELSKNDDKEGAEWLKERAEALSDKNKEQGIPGGIIKIVADPNTSGVLYAGLSRGLYRSTDYGKYWLPLNIIESAEKFPIPSIAINPDDSDEIAFVAGDTFYRSVNYGSTWAVTPLDKTRNASFVTFDPYDPSIVYVGLSAKK